MSTEIAEENVTSSVFFGYLLFGLYLGSVLVKQSFSYAFHCAKLNVLVILKQGSGDPARAAGSFLVLKLEDMLKIGQLAMSNETIAKYAAVAQIETGLKDVPVWHNTNWLVRPESEYYCPYAKGLKTGRTTEAGNCLMSAFAIDGEQYIIGVFGCEKTADRFADTLHLLNGALGVTQ